MSYFIDVILPLPLEKLFTYSVTKEEAFFIKPGMRVAVPFGKTKIYTGLVHKVHNNAPLVYEAKDIHQILDEKPIVNTIQLEFWGWIAKYYLCTLGEVMRAALPSAFILESETIIVKNSDIFLEEDSLQDDEFLVYEALHHKSSLKVQEIADIIDKKTALPTIKRLMDKQVIALQEEIIEKYTPKLIRYIRIHKRYDNEAGLKQLFQDLNRAPKQQKILLTLFSLKGETKKPIKATELIKKSKASSSTLKNLVDKKILEEYYLQTDRIDSFTGSTESTKTLSTEQLEALHSIKEQYESRDVVLLHGVTSSGKTEVYTKLIEQTLKKGRQVLYLLPEIALTTQLVNRLQNYFGKQVAVFHSRYSLNERVEVWNQVLNNSEKSQIVLGARSSVFLPFSNLRLIIVDEEHEPSYKQFDPAPRYHARDSAIVLAKMHNAKILLGSATPSLESYYNAQQGKYGLVELLKRYNNLMMPDMELVDIKDKYRRKRMKGHFSDRLMEEMTEALQEGSQVILFQNRRGFSPIVECLTCGHSPQCPNCDVSLTYHQKINQLRCHYCGYHIAMPLTCMACGRSDLDTKGFGTEQIEQEVKQLFPKVTVGRMDFDTTKGKYGHERIITAFEQQEVDVLVGTQMVTKGLDFRNVKLVGIMNADTMLNFPDFRAHERSFQMIQQVAGRAGRTQSRGKVLIQTYNPYHKILQQAASNDYKGIFQEQLNERFNYKYPPIYKLIKITLKHRDYNKINESAIWLSNSLRHVFKDRVLGPEFPPIPRIRNQYIKNIIIKIPPKQSLSKTKEAILKIKNSFESIKDFRSVKVNLNVDNY